MAAYLLTGEAAFDRRRTGDGRGAGRTAPATAHEGETMRRHLTASAACLLAMSMLCGCLMDGTIDKSGGGTLTVRQRLANKEQFEQAKKRLQSADVTMTDASVGDDKWATFQVSLPTSPSCRRPPSSSTRSSPSTTTRRHKDADRQVRQPEPHRCRTSWSPTSAAP
jgi:hypothetical protein